MSTDAEQTRFSTPPTALAGRTGVVEVGSVDANMIFDDASAALRSGKDSVFLYAIDVGTVAAVMSDQAFRELGWMSAKAARGHQVDHEALRALITSAYLPRIPVAVVPTPLNQSGGPSGACDPFTWMPDASDIRDPHDVPHGQLARLVSATVVFSHDKDLRIPGYSPRLRRDFDERIGLLQVVTEQRVLEHGTAIALSGAGKGVASMTSMASTRLGVRPVVGWGLVVFAATVGGYVLAVSAERRRKISDALRPIGIGVGEYYARATAAHGSLMATRLLQPTDHDRLEVRVASALIRCPGQNITELSETLQLGARERPRMARLLREHWVFEQTSRYGWSVGRTRSRLETVPASGSTSTTNSTPAIGQADPSRSR